MAKVALQIRLWKAQETQITEIFYLSRFSDYCLHLNCYIHNVSADMSSGLLQVLLVELVSLHETSNHVLYLISNDTDAYQEEMISLRHNLHRNNYPERITSAPRDLDRRIEDDTRINDKIFITWANLIERIRELHEMLRVYNEEKVLSCWWNVLKIYTKAWYHMRFVVVKDPAPFGRRTYSCVLLIVEAGTKINR